MAERATCIHPVVAISFPKWECSQCKKHASNMDLRQHCFVCELDFCGACVGNHGHPTKRIACDLFGNWRCHTTNCSTKNKSKNSIRYTCGICSCVDLCQDCAAEHNRAVGGTTTNVAAAVITTTATTNPSIAAAVITTNAPIAAAAVVTTTTTDDDDKLCKVCLDKPCCIAFVPCGHLAVCQHCSEMQFCLICRAPIASKLKIFQS